MKQSQSKHNFKHLCIFTTVTEHLNERQILSDAHKLLITETYYCR